MTSRGAFDYEAARWGADRLRPDERSIAGFRLAEALVHLPRSGRLLEVGCGHGRMLCALAEIRPDLSLVGCDVSRAALAALSRRAPQVETRLSGGDAIPAADAEFDCLLAIDVLEHVADPARLLAETHRALAPGGVLHLHVPCEGDPRSLWRWIPGQAGESGLKRRFGGHLHRFRRDEILRRVEAAGFRILRVRHSLHLVGNVADVAAFAALAFANRRSRRGERRTTGDPVAGGGRRTTGDPVAGGGRRTTGDLVASRHPVVRAVDALLYAEARLLGRLPSWSLHLSAARDAEPRS